MLVKIEPDDSIKNCWHRTAMLVIFISLMFSPAQASPKIEVSCGQLRLEGYNSCEIKHNHEVFNYTGPPGKVLPGPFFGLITYRCDQTAGYLMSEINCEKCNFECSEEGQPINACQTDIAQFWTGVFLGGLLSILLGAFFWKHFHPSCPITLNRENGRENILEKETMSAVYSEDHVILKENPEVQSDVDNEGHSRSKTTKKTLMSVIIGILLLKTVNACNIVVIMALNNVTVFCEGSDCGVNHPDSFILRHGQVICLEDHSGEEKVTLEVSKISWRVRYELAYYTSDYTERMTTASVCCQTSFYLCDSHCFTDALAILKDKRPNNSSAERSCLSGHSWDTNVACVFLHERERKGDIYSVFNLQRNALYAEKIEFILKKGNHSQVITMGEHDTHEIDLTNLKMKNIKTISITVFDGESKFKHNALFQHDEKLYRVNSSDLPSFSSAEFGDFQIRLNKQDVRFIPNEREQPIDCTGQHTQSSCDCTCSFKTTESAVSKFLRQKDDFQQAENIIVRRNDSSVVIDSFEVQENDRWELEMRLGSVLLSDFKRMKGKCDVTVLGNFGCSSCNESAYVVVTTQNIEKEGMMPFHSNCSFDRLYINCDPYEPTKLVSKSNEDTCYIRLVTTNKQIVVNMKYFNYGHQVKPKHQINCTKTYSDYSEVFVHFVTNGPLIKAFAATVVCFLFVGILVNIVLTVFNKRSRRSIRNTSVKGENDLLEL